MINKFNLNELFIHCTITVALHQIKGQGFRGQDEQIIYAEQIDTLLQRLDNIYIF